jgi:hypothetical protein
MTAILKKPSAAILKKPSAAILKKPSAAILKKTSTDRCAQFRARRNAAKVRKAHINVTHRAQQALANNEAYRPRRYGEVAVAVALAAEREAVVAKKVAKKAQKDAGTALSTAQLAQNEASDAMALAQHCKEQTTGNEAMSHPVVVKKIEEKIAMQRQNILKVTEASCHELEVLEKWMTLCTHGIIRGPMAEEAI